MRISKQSDNALQNSTKELLKASLIELMKQKPIHQISVQELANQAHISRSNFYYYYPSIMCLAGEIESEFIMELKKINIDFFTDPISDFWYTNPNPYIEKTLRLEYCHRDMILAFLNQSDTTHLKRYLIECIQNHFISKRLFSSNNKEHDLLLDEFLIEGHIAMIRKWLESEEYPDFGNMAIKVYSTMFSKESSDIK